MPSILSIQYMGGREADFGNTKDRRCRRGWLVKTDGRFYSEASLLQDAVVFAGGAAGIPIPFVSTHPDSPRSRGTTMLFRAALCLCLLVKFVVWLSISLPLRLVLKIGR